MNATYEDWKEAVEALNGRTGHHAELAKLAEKAGCEVVADPDDNEKSFIAGPGEGDFGDRVIGTIVGDSEALIRVTASIR